MQPLVCVIILNYNGRNWLKDCLESLCGTDYQNLRIIFVDNNSSDGSVDLVKTSFPKVNMIINDDNYGFCKGNNIGIDLALNLKADYVVLLNNDTRVEANWLAEMIVVGEENPSVGILGAVQLTYHDNEFNSWTKSVAKEHLAELGDPSTARSWIPMRWVEGSCFAIKRKVIEEVGVLDPIYFMYHEEIDYCRRAAAHGYETALLPRCRIHHYRGGTSKASEEAKRTRALQYDRSHLIYHATDLRRSFSVNLLRYGMVVISKCFQQLKLRRYGRFWDVVCLQPGIIKSLGMIRHKWKKDKDCLKTRIRKFVSVL